MKLKIILFPFRIYSNAGEIKLSEYFLKSFGVSRQSIVSSFFRFMYFMKLEKTEDLFSFNNVDIKEFEFLINTFERRFV